MADAPTTPATDYNAVAKVSDVQNKMHHRSKVERTLMGGTHAMRRAEGEYLPKEPAESEDAYQCRLMRTFLFNAFGKTVSDMTGKVFMKPIVLKPSVPKELVTFAEDIDLTGRHINVFARDVFFDGMQVGGGYILIDLPPSVVRADGATPTLADEQKANLRPFLTYITLENLIGWKSQMVNGAATLTQVRFKECVTEPDGLFGEKEIEQIKVLTPGAWQTFRKAQTGSDWVPFESGNSRLPKITLVPFYVQRTGFMTFEPPLEKLAELNVAHWQSQSDQKNILHVARVPILFGAGFSADEKLIVGVNSATVTTNPLAKLTYVEHTGAAIASGDKDLQNIEAQMSAVGAQLTQLGPNGQSATGEISDDYKENSPLAMMARSLADALEQALGYMNEYLGAAPDLGGEIDINTDFGVTAMRTDLQQLLGVRQAGDLSQETLWEEMQRRDYLSEAFDPEVEKDRIASEPVLAAPPMDLGEPGGPPKPGAPPVDNGSQP
jgi:hypothetical protein